VTRVLVPEDTPEGVSMFFYICPGCEAVHVVLVDENDVAIAIGALSPESFDRAVAQVQSERAAKLLAPDFPAVQGSA